MFSGLRGYAVALVSVGLALAVRLVLDPYEGNLGAYAPFYLAVVVTVWLGGTGPGLCATVAGVLTSSWFFIPPRHSFLLANPGDYAAAGLFLLASAIFVAFVRALRSALRSAETSAARAERAGQALEESQIRLKELNLQLESKVAERTARLQETIAKLEHVSYSLSHDMRAPLRAMHNFAELLLLDYSERIDGEGNRYLRQIVTAADRLDKLISDTLAYSRVAHREVTLTAVDVAALVRNLIDSYPQLHAEGVEIRVEPGLAVVLGNEVLLAQCFCNLLDNAVKFVPRDTRPRITVRPEARTSSVRFWIEDNGIGIPKEAQDRVFEMFERAAPDHEGTGIGLAIVRKAVELMGGKVGVESEVGEGSRFWVELAKA
jgi:signal transduction histidine kinase